ncbi:MAG: rhodanese-like domain-containing protein [Syntrophomonadaceae bacterium]
MKKRFQDLTIEKKLGLAALLLGFLALFGADPYNHAFSSVNTKEIAFAAESRSTKVDPLELAGWIIKGKADYKLVDVRSEKEFNEYHIPEAQNFALVELQNSSIEKTEKILLYSGNEMDAAQGWFLLRSKGYKAVYILSGGLEAWKSQVLFPSIALSTNPDETMKSEKIKQISRYFGGVPQVSGSDSSVTAKTEMPKLQAPVQQSQAGTSSRRTKKEGC